MHTALDYELHSCMDKTLKASKSDTEMSQSHSTDQPTAPRGKETDH